MTFAVGSSSWSNCSRFGVISALVWVTPVTFPPGLFSWLQGQSLPGQRQFRKQPGWSLSLPLPQAQPT